MTPPQADIAVKSLPIQQPFHYEVSCPISCAGLSIGCYNHEGGAKPFETYDFRTSTQRVVSVTVNEDITCLVNNNKPQNKDKKKTTNNKTWGIGLKVKEKGNFLVLNPYVSGKSPLLLYVFVRINLDNVAIAGSDNW